MKNFLVIFIAFFSLIVFSQNKQTILISSKFEFQAEKNSYGINTVLKSILVSNNFNVYFDDETLPLEIAQNRCNALTGILIDNSNLFVTKVKLQIKDCQNNLLYETAVVKSKEKDIQTGFMEAIKLLSPEIKKYKVTLIQKKTADTTSAEIVTKPNSNFQFIETVNGFSFVDQSLKIVIKLNKTTNPKIFIAEKNGVTGIFTKLENKGIFEYYFEEKLVVEEFVF